MIRNLVFDMGNVLLDYHPMTTCLRHAENQEDANSVFQALFLAPEWEQKLDSCLIPEAEMLQIAQSRLPSPELRELCARIFAVYHEDSMTPVPGMDELIPTLKRRGFGLYILSNAGARFSVYQHIIPCIGLFDGVLTSGEEKVIKPDPAIFHRFCARFSLQPEECLFIDDRQMNVDAAKGVGMEGYVFPSGGTEGLRRFAERMPNPKE